MRCSRQEGAGRSNACGGLWRHWSDWFASGWCAQPPMHIMAKKVPPKMQKQNMSLTAPWGGRTGVLRCSPVVSLGRREEEKETRTQLPVSRVILKLVQCKPGLERQNSSHWNKMTAVLTKLKAHPGKKGPKTEQCVCQGETGVPKAQCLVKAAEADEEVDLLPKQQMRPEADEAACGLAERATRVCQLGVDGQESTQEGMVSPRQEGTWERTRGGFSQLASWGCWSFQRASVPSWGQRRSSW